MHNDECIDILLNLIIWVSLLCVMLYSASNRTYKLKISGGKVNENAQAKVSMFMAHFHRLY